MYLIVYCCSDAKIEKLQVAYQYVLRSDITDEEVLTIHFLVA